MVLGICVGACDVPWRGDAPMDPGPALPMPLHRCGVYHAVPNAYQFCVYKSAEFLNTIEEVATVCPMAGELEGECRRVWVAAHVSTGFGFSTDDLVAACGANTDCVLEVLDARADPDLAVQIQRCDAHGGPYASDCVVHAAERWARGRPDATEVSRIAALKTAWPDRIGYAIATVVTCQGVGACGGDLNTAAACSDAVARILEEPSLCVSHGASGGTGAGP